MSPHRIQHICSPFPTLVSSCPSPVICMEHLLWVFLHILIWWNSLNSKEPKVCVQERRRGRKEKKEREKKFFLIFFLKKNELPPKKKRQRRHSIDLPYTTGGMHPISPPKCSSFLKQPGYNICWRCYRQKHRTTLSCRGLTSVVRWGGADVWHLTSGWRQGWRELFFFFMAGVYFLGKK